MHLNNFLRFAILAFISVISNFQEVSCSTQSEQTNKTFAYFDFSVIHAQNSSTDPRNQDDFSYFCLLDVIGDAGVHNVSFRFVVSFFYY